MKILNAAQLKELDAYTIKAEKIKSIDLMERASVVATARISKLLGHDQQIDIFCGSGNNGGDGLAIARLLLEQKHAVRVILPRYGSNLSEDAERNYQYLKKLYPGVVTEINTMEELKSLHLEHHYAAVDALFGTGLNKPLEGFLAEVVTFLNKNYKKIISIDIPSGLYADKSSTDLLHIVRCNLCLSFQMPKLAFLLPQNQAYVPEFEILDIGLSVEKQAATDSHYYYVTGKEISQLLKPRLKFSHKGNFGHALLVAGSKGKSGAAIIASEACLRSGAGLLTLHSVRDSINAVLRSLPEAMSDEDLNTAYISNLEISEKYSGICFGPGTGIEPETETVLKKIVQYYSGPLLIDADGLNILSSNKTWLEFLPKNCILSPHPREFERLTEKITDDFERLETIRKFSMRYGCILIYKGAHTAIAMPDGNVFFNSSGNAGLAKGGSGDALSGIILGLLARGYSSPQAALIGTFIHGYAADLCRNEMSAEAMLISDVLRKLPQAFLQLEEMQGF